MTQFRVLPVRQGDAYLLKSGRGSYLVDGGAMSGFLPEMLRERRVGKLRSVVCTHACPERLGGIIDLMDSGYPVGEYWLPESLRTVAEAARNFSGDWAGWLGLCGWPVPDAPFPVLETSACDPSERKLTAAATMACLALAACFGMLPSRTSSSPTPTGAMGEILGILAEQTSGRWDRGLSPIIRDVGERFCSGGGPGDLALLCGRFLFREADALPVRSRGSREVARGMALALMVEVLRVMGGCRVRFFRATDRWEDYLVPRHPFKCLNGMEAAASGGSPAPAGARAVFRTASAFSGLGDGLVFQYGDARCGVLFCGNTRMSFMGRRGYMTLRRPTVITAPQWGGVAADAAYDRIVSRDPSADVWVRAHYSYALKVSEAFRARPVKCCLHNTVLRAVQEVVLSFSAGRWNRLICGACGRS